MAGAAAAGVGAGLIGSAVTGGFNLAATQMSVEANKQLQARDQNFTQGIINQHKTQLNQAGLPGFMAYGGSGGASSNPANYVRQSYGNYRSAPVLGTSGALGFNFNYGYGKMGKKSVVERQGPNRNPIVSTSGFENPLFRRGSSASNSSMGSTSSRGSIGSWDASHLTLGGTNAYRRLPWSNSTDA